MKDQERGDNARSEGAQPAPEVSEAALASPPEEDPVELARAAQEALARSLAAVRGVWLATTDEPAFIFRP